MEKNITIDQNIPYNQAIQEIEKILQEMQSPNCDIDKLAENTRRASQLIELCRSRLMRTEKEIETVLATMNVTP